MKIAGSLWWWFGQRLRDAGGHRARVEPVSMDADWIVHRGQLLAKRFQWWM